MTLVVGVETVAPDTGKPIVLLCSDSRASHTSGMVFETGPKVIRTDTGWVVGYSGELRFQHALFAALRRGGDRFRLPPAAPEAVDPQDLQDVLTLEWLPYFRQALENNGFTGKWDNKEWTTDDHGSLLLGAGGYLFDLAFWTVRRAPVAAIGCARQYALGVLDLMKLGRQKSMHALLWTTHDLHFVVGMAAARYSDVGLPSTCIWTGSAGSQTRGESSLPEEGEDGRLRGDGKIWRRGEWRDPE